MGAIWEELKRWPFAFGALVMLALYASTLVEFEAGDRRPAGSPADIEGLASRTDLNLLFVLIDTLRAERLGSYGYARDTSPGLDYLAASGVRFARHLSQSSWTKASMASLWTGRNPIRTGVKRYDHALPEAASMPAELLAEAGFRTAGIWRNGWVDPNFGFAQGFDVYQRPGPDPVPVALRRESPHATLGGSDYDAVRSAVEFLRIHGERRWFLYLHLMDLHQYVYDAESARFGAGYSSMYDNSIRHVDAVVSELLNQLSERGQLDRTLVAVASDHGEAFRERGLEGHARAVYRESTEVPLILGFPFRLEPGIVVDSRTRNIDVWPTLLELLGAPPLPDTDGLSLVPEMLAAAQGESGRLGELPAYAFLDQTWGRPAEAPLPALAVARGDHRFVSTRQRAGGGLREELFDRDGDVLERRDVLSEQPEIAAELRALARQHLEGEAASPWGVETPRIEIGQLHLQQLRALGYDIP